MCEPSASYTFTSPGAHAARGRAAVRLVCHVLPCTKGAEDEVGADPLLCVVPALRDGTVIAAVPVCEHDGSTVDVQIRGLVEVPRAQIDEVVVDLCRSR